MSQSFLKKVPFYIFIVNDGDATDDIFAIVL